MLTSPVRILRTVYSQVVQYTGLPESKVRLSVAHFLPFDWFPQCVTIFPKNIFVRRVSATDGTAMGALAASPIQQLSELHFGISVKTFGGSDEVGVDLLHLDDNSLSNPDSHIYVLQRCLSAVNGLYIKDAGKNNMITLGCVAIHSIDPIGKRVEPSELSMSNQGRFVIESIVNCYVVFEPLSRPDNFVNVVNAT